LSILYICRLKITPFRSFLKAKLKPKFYEV
jgi:hypothetical protein